MDLIGTVTTATTWSFGITGAQGTQGTQGFQGTQGNQGNQGFQGFQGLTGAQGVQGTQGTQGFQGTQGNQGNQGFQGFQGLTGAQGVQGTQGNQGFQGFQGLTGAQGAQGSQGNQGFQGNQGTTGTNDIMGYSSATQNSAATTWYFSPVVPLGATSATTESAKTFNAFAVKSFDLESTTAPGGSNYTVSIAYGTDVGLTAGTGSIALGTWTSTLTSFSVTGLSGTIPAGDFWAIKIVSGASAPVSTTIRWTLSG